MNTGDNEIFGDNQSPLSIQDRLAVYLNYWPLFMICILLSLVAGYMYIRYTAPKYIATTRFLIKGADVGGKNDDLIESAMNGKTAVNLNNEMLLVSASSLMERTVARNNFNVTYYKTGRLSNIDIYRDAPFELVVQNTSVNDSYTLKITEMNSKGAVCYFGTGKNPQPFSFSWRQPFVLTGQIFTLVPKRAITDAGKDTYIIRWQPIREAAAELSAAFSVKAFDTKTSVLELSVKTGNIQRGKDLLNALFFEFNLSDIEERNRISDSTVSFIDERMIGIANELQGVEGSLENYQGKRQLVDIKGQSSQSLINANDVGKTIKDINIQQRIAGMITGYFENPVNSNKLVPSSLGLNDATLSSLITQYNELQLKKERELPSSTPDGLIIQDLNNQIGNLKSSILESLSSINVNLSLQEKSFQAQNSQYTNFLSSIPHSERVLQEIKRKQNITEGLYLYLLQKREEAAISRTASDLANYKQIDPATGYGPVEPNSKNIYMYSFMLGFFLAFGYVYMRVLVNDKVMSRADLRKCASIPLIAEISTLPTRKKQLISVLDRNVTAEEFRTARTRLSPLLKNKNEQVVLVTSSSRNEGKSFVSLNLAAVYASAGKKVALLDFDIRQRSLSIDLELTDTPGLTDFLSGRVHTLAKIAHASAEVPGLDTYASGFVPKHPSDLLLAPQISRLFESLKAEYDYIIVDSSPAGLVTDPFIIAEYADKVLYVIRCGQTRKKDLDFMIDAVRSNTLKDICLILNDVKRKYRDGYEYQDEYNSSSANGSVHKKNPAVQFEKQW
jgi:capsular exopolysaccharide synthesis family protein